jgi:NTP pyrophosphatase (non-canonical NTP hydrolase)
MNLDEYQEQAASTAVYPENVKILYPALGLIGECGEVAEKVKKLIRDDNFNMTSERKNAIKKELGDCCWYLAASCRDTGHELSMAYDMRRSFGIHPAIRIRKMTWPKLVFRMNRNATMMACSMENWYYAYGGRLSESNRFLDIPHCVTKLLVCIEEMAKRCNFTLEEVYSDNIEKLLSRKKRGKIKGDGDNR